MSYFIHRPKIPKRLWTGNLGQQATKVPHLSCGRQAMIHPSNAKPPLAEFPLAVPVNMANREVWIKTWFLLRMLAVVFEEGS
jgi:hypothetical protein